MKRLATIGLGGLAASLLFLGCASAPAPTKVDPVLNPKGLPEIAPEDAEPLIPPQIEAERAAIADRPFALPANFAEGEWERMVVAINPYDNVADSETVRTAQLAALNAGIRATLGKLTRFEVREVSADKPDPACTHTAKWTAAIRGEAKPTDDPRRRDLVLTCDLRLTFSDARSKTQAGSHTFTESVSLPQTLGADGTVASGADLANQGTLTVPLRQLGSKLGVRIAQALSESAPCGGDILACDDVDEMTMEGGSFQGVYDGLQMLVYATIDGLPLPLGYADAKPGSTRTNLTLWKLNEADPMAQAVLDALDDDPDAFAKYKLRAIAVGDPLPPIWRRQVAQPSEAAR